MRLIIKRFGKVILVIILLLTVSCSYSNVSLNPGVYEGSGRGWNSDTPITISVAIDDEGKISEINILSEDETPDIGGLALDELIKEIESEGENIKDLDSISKATATSEGFKEALKDALSKAKE